MYVYIYIYIHIIIYVYTYMHMFLYPPWHTPIGTLESCKAATCLTAIPLTLR